MALAAAVLAAALAVALTGTVLHAGEPGHAITVLNPKSYPLVGGTWAVNLDVAGGGDLAVSAVGSGVGGTDTMFGRDIEFAGMHHHDSGTSLAPSSVGDDGILRFEDVREGRWTFDVNVLTAGPHHLRFDLGGDRAYASNTASLADVTSRTPDGRYLPGDTVEVLVNFTEPVTLGAFGIRGGGGDGTGGTFEELDGAYSIATAQIDGSHYALVAAYNDDGVQIINITDPGNPSAAAHITNGTAYPELEGAYSITTAQIGGSHYALVASFIGDGVQIINITNPGNPSAAAHITNGTTYPELDDASSITTAQIGDSHYALVAAYGGDGVQIIDITDPGNPSPVASLTNGTTYPELEGAASITTARIGNSHYALVASIDDDGVQIINITDPGNPSAAAHITNGTAYPELGDASSITTAQIGGSHYALVASFIGDGVQIINITDPGNPSAAASLTDGAAYPELDGAYSITTARIGGSHYALVASFWDNGVQIIDITDPGNPSPVASLTNGTTYPELGGANSITTARIGNSHYALVASQGDDGVQIIDITDPAHPHNPLLPHVELDLAGEGRAAYAGQAHGGRALVFEYAVRGGDRTADLAYAGTGALVLGLSTLADADDSTDLSGVTLPAPGAPHSLSHNKAISLGRMIDPDQFTTTWRTDSANEEITLPVRGSGITIYWGDGTNSTGVSGDAAHTYAAAGNHTVDVAGGLEAFTLDNHANATKLVSIDRWGNASWTTMRDAFRGAANMVYNAADSPDLSGVTDMNSMFQSSSINGDISGWDVSGVTDMSSMFNDAFAFNGDVSGWDVSGVTDMSRMFSGAPLFNGDVSGWDVSAVQDMNRMFFLAEAFNQNLNDWDVSAVTNMLRMFSGASLFNGDVSGWDVSAVQNMDRMFFLAEAFNQNLGKWYVVLGDTTIDLADAGSTVGSISAQNSILNEHSPTYGLGSDSASQKFAISGSELQVKPNEDYSGGSYGVTITATGTGLFGTSNQRTVGVTVTNTTQSNTPPTVDAGPAQAANEGRTVTLAGTATDHDQTDTLTYSWSQTSPASPALTLSSPTSLTTTFTAPQVAADTAFTFTLSVSDGTATVTDTVTVTVRDVPGTNTPPTVDAGPAQAANEGRTVTLAGTATDPDQTDTLTYSWSQTSPASPALTLSSPTSLTTTFTAPQVAADTAFTFTLSVSDGTATVTDTVTVTVNDRPVQTDSRSKTWTVDDMVGIMGGKGQHDLELISRCDEGTTPTGASTELHLLGLLGQASYGTFNVDMESTWVWIIEAYRLAYHYLDTGKDTITEDPIPEGLEGYGITLDQYIDAAPGDTFEYPDGNYTKAQLGGMTAWSASIDWTGDGSCSLDFRQETWVP